VDLVGITFSDFEITYSTSLKM